MNVALIIGLLVLLVLIFFVRSERNRGRRVYGRATGLEKNKDYEAACFYYAVAMNAGHDKTLCQKKIIELWKQYGPFEFKKELEEAKAEYCRYESCGEGIHSLTVSDIHKIVDTIK